MILKKIQTFEPVSCYIISCLSHYHSDSNTVCTSLPLIIEMRVIYVSYIEMRAVYVMEVKLLMVEIIKYFFFKIDSDICY